jgi:hypothetical protein
MPANDCQPGIARANPEAARPVSSADYFAAAHDLFLQTLRRHRVHDWFGEIGGQSIFLRITSKILARTILPALAHLESKPAISDLTIGMGDLADSNAAFPFPGDEDTAGEPEGAMWRHEDARFFILNQKETRALSLLDAEMPQALYWTRDAAQLPWPEGSFPMRHLFANFFGRQGKFIVHAAAVGNERGAVLIVGKGGSGKSTAALACAMNGLFYLGDDYSLVGIEPEPRVWSLYSSAKVNADSLIWFPQLKPFVQHDGGMKEKSLLQLHGAPGLRFAASLPIRAVLWPRITGRIESQLKPASSAALLLALAPSSILQTPGHGDAVLRMLNRLVQAVPTRILETGTDPAQIAGAVGQFIGP